MRSAKETSFKIADKGWKIASTFTLVGLTIFGLHEHAQRVQADNNLGSQLNAQGKQIDTITETQKEASNFDNILCWVTGQGMKIELALNGEQIPPGPVPKEICEQIIYPQIQEIYDTPVPTMPENQGVIDNK